LLVGESQWDETTPTEFTSSYLEPFGGLRAILLLLDTNDEDGYEGPEDTEDAESANGENVMEQGNLVATKEESRLECSMRMLTSLKRSTQSS
jgi:hypothetical protein